MSQINFIRETPADADRLGTHTRVATALAAVLEASVKVRTIGLLGRWGAGKSTTVNLARLQLAKREEQKIKKTRFFIYDAWAQQSDPPRRAFLESLIRFLDKESIAPAETWNKQVDLLIRRAEIHDIETTPTLTGWGMAFAIALACVPIGIFLARPDSNVRMIGNALLFTPILVLVISRIFFNILKQTDSEEANKANRASALFFNKSVDKTRNTIIKTPDPTSVEFRETFYDIMDHVCDEGQRFVIVIDNLDRISAEDAVTMWASIRALIDGETSRDRVSKDSFKVIVPFDQTSISHLFDNIGKDQPTDEAAKKAQAFVEKTFDVSLVVGPPIDSDWRDYLDEALLYVFSDNISAIDRMHTVRIFEELFDKSGIGLGITPRRLNTYANTLGSVWLQWGSDLNFCSLAYFSARSIWKDQGLTDVLGADAPASRLMDRLSENWRVEVAAVHYGVAPDKARQLVIEPELDRAVSEGDFDKFSGISEMPGFARTLEDWLRKGGAASGPFNGLDAAALLNAAAWIRTTLPDSPARDEVWVALREATLNIAGWSKPTPFARSGREALLEVLPEAVVSLVKALAVKDTRLDVGPWVEMLDAILPPDATTAVLKQVTVPFEGLRYIALLQEVSLRDLVAKRPLLVRVLKPKEGASKAMEAFASSVSSEQGSAILAALRAAVAVDAPWEFSAVAEALEERALVAPELLPSITEGLLLIADKGEAPLQRLAENGSFAHLFAAATADGNSRNQALAVFALSFGPPGRLTGDSSRGDSSRGWELLQQLESTLQANQSEFRSAFKEIYNNSSRWNDRQDSSILRFVLHAADSNRSWRPLLGWLIEFLVENGSVGRRVFTRDVLERIPLIASVTEPPVLNKFVSRLTKLNSWQQTLPDLEDERFWALANGLAYGKAIKDQPLSAEADDRLKKLSSQTWLDFISDPPDYLDDMLAVVGTRPNSSIKSAIVDGFEKWVNQLSSQSYNLGLSASSFDRLFKILPAAKRRIWSKTLVDYVEESDPERSVSILTVTWRSLVEALGEDNLVDDLVRKVLLRAILSDNEGVTGAISRGWPSLSVLLGRAGEDIREDIRSREIYLSKLAQLRGVDVKDISGSF